MLLMYNEQLSSDYEIEHTTEAINRISEKLSRHLIIAAKSYENKTINHGDEQNVYKIYAKAIANLLKEDKKQLSYIQRKKSASHGFRVT